MHKLHTICNFDACLHPGNVAKAHTLVCTASNISKSTECMQYGVVGKKIILMCNKESLPVYFTYLGVCVYIYAWRYIHLPYDIINVWKIFAMACTCSGRIDCLSVCKFVACIFFISSLPLVVISIASTAFKSCLK